MATPSTARGVVGTCQPTGFCSLPDSGCASGQRYVDQADAPLAGACVGASGGDDEGAGDGDCDGGRCPSGCVVAVASGALHSCALNALGKVYCWGDNSFLQLGSSGDARETTP